VTYVFLQCGLERVVARIPTGFDSENQRSQPDKRDAFDRIGHGISCESVDRVRRTGKERLIVAPPQGQVGARRAGIGD